MKKTINTSAIYFLKLVTGIGIGLLLFLLVNAIF